MTAPVWLFDLDNTLHDATPHIFPHISRSMTAYLVEHLALSEEDASALRVRYWQRYGATLLGLVRHHGTDPKHFLWHTHQFPELQRMVVWERGLRAALRRLPGRKIVFSNAPLHYAEAVLEITGLRGLFDAVFTIEHMRFQPKPALRAFRRLLRQHRLAPDRCIMVEDTPENLRPARLLGMKTVWVTRSPRNPAYVDIRIQSVTELPRLAARGFLCRPG
ncbi:MAG: pyrimidine 5'-nucleotidase [Betaproteobacteria bacterium]|nr:pyrimidine 5'-nucleotidase [Betaproteobacteria bacterium]